ncbi:unnamed protein product [Paramecium octaurelia]|uniref:Uncharacterized protein n=1 Tax=Paramecium octaurelia TaxID=43137 RepID=A0A8S1TBR0_PAROT|nr:unnamed protein product [Paramecium octaurelia]
MSQIQYQASGDSPLVAFEEDNGELNSFFAKMKSVGWNQASLNKEHQKLATYNEIMIYFVKVFVLLALMLTTFYGMAFILLATKAQIIKNGEIVQFNFILYIISFVITLLIGRWAYFSESSRKFPLNIFVIFYSHLVQPMYLGSLYHGSQKMGTIQAKIGQYYYIYLL